MVYGWLAVSWVDEFVDWLRVLYVFGSFRFVLDMFGLVTEIIGESYVVLLTELLGERCAHDGAADAGRSRKVRLARLSPGGGKGCVSISVLTFSRLFCIIPSAYRC